jgi:hypothetical protein
MYYDRKIKYLNYFERGERIKGAGFVKMEARDKSLRMELSVTGLHETDTFEREIFLCTEGREEGLGRIQITGGRGQWRWQWQNLENIGGTGISYGQLSGVSIHLGAGREISCRWEADSRAVKGTDISGVSAGKTELYIDRKGKAIGGEAPSFGKELQAAEMQDIPAEGARGAERGLAQERERLQEEGRGSAEREARRGTQERRSPEYEGSIEREAEEKAGQYEKGAVIIEREARRGTQERRGAEYEGGIGREAEEKAGQYKKGAVIIDREAWRGMQERRGEEYERAARRNTAAEEEGVGQHEEGYWIRDRERGDETEERRGMGHGGHRKRAEGMNRRKEVLGIADKEEGNGRKESGSPEQGIYRRRGAVQAGRETEPYYAEKNGDAGRRQSHAGGKRNAEEMHRQESIPETEKLMEEKWGQLWAIYPHIRPFQDEREYISIRPADFVIFPEDSYKMVNNSFLLHGYYNYHHLLLTRAERKGELCYYIGVPGNFFEKEKQVAIMFGFESFECAQEPAQAGDFGYYMMRTRL